MPQRPVLTAPDPPTFAGAALLPGRQFVLFNVAKIETVQGLCTDPGGNNVCLLLSPAYVARVNAQTATVCRLAGVTLTCTLPAAIAFKDGDQVTVTLGKAVNPIGQPPAATSRTFTAYQLRRASIAGITASGNVFTLAGTGLVPALPAFTRALTVFEYAQGQMIGRIPSTITSSTPTALGVTLTHPNLSKKILRFQIDTTCPGWTATNSIIVLRDSTPQGGPGVGGKSTSAEFRMPGAARHQRRPRRQRHAQVWAPGAPLAPASKVHIVVGNARTRYQNFLVNHGAAIANLVLEFTTSGPLSLGLGDGNSRAPVLRQYDNFDVTIPHVVLRHDGGALPLRGALVPAIQRRVAGADGFLRDRGGLRDGEHDLSHLRPDGHGPVLLAPADDRLRRR